MVTIIIDGIEDRTAASFQRLAKLRGVECDIRWDKTARKYTADGEAVGTDVGALYDWLDRQPGVKP